MVLKSHTQCVNAFLHGDLETAVELYERSESLILESTLADLERHRWLPRVI